MKLKTPVWIAEQSLVVKALGGTLLVLLLILAFVAWRWRAAKAETARVQLEKTNVEARTTPSREFTEKELGALRKVVQEEVAGATRPIVQVPQRNDALDRVLAQDRVMMTALTASIASLTAHAASTGSVVSSAGDSVRSAAFDVRDEPYTLHADVKLPRPPAKGSLDANVTLDPAHLWPRIGCGEAVHGVRPARYSIAGPKWLAIVIDSTSQDPDVCNPNLGAKYSAFRPELALSLGYSVQVDPATRQVRQGPSVQIGVTIWHCPIALRLLRGRCQ